MRIKQTEPKAKAKIQTRPYNLPQIFLMFVFLA